MCCKFWEISNNTLQSPIPRILDLDFRLDNYFYQQPFSNISIKLEMIEFKGGQNFQSA